MLSVSAGLGFAASTGSDPSLVITLGASHAVCDVWTFDGTVTDNGYPVAGLKVQFGGVLGRYNLTATVESNGTYDITEILPNLISGTATAQTHDSAGVASNVAMTFVDSRNYKSSANSAGESGGPGATIAAAAGASRYPSDGEPAADAALNSPQGIATDSAGDLFIADTGSNVICEFNASTGTITTVAGDGICGFGGDDGAATSAELDAPAGIAVDIAGNLFITDNGNDRIREVNHATGMITTVVGSGVYGFSGDGSAAASAELNSPLGVAVDSAGDLFIADTGNNVIREVGSATGVISTVAGSYSLGSGYGGDGGAATSAKLSSPVGVAVDTSGNLFIADTGNNVIRQVDLTTGVISTVAGNYGLGGGYSGDSGAATSAQLDCPAGVAVSAGGILFVADTGNNVVRKVNLASGLISTVAGSGTQGYSGNGDAATSAELSGPEAVAVNPAGDLLIADSNNNAIRAVDPSIGLIAAVAGPGIKNYSGDGGQATAAGLYDPLGVAADAAGNLFIADTGNNVVREVNSSTGVISTVAGNGACGCSGNGGAATSAELDDPTDVTVDAAGDLFIADTGNNVVREVDLATGVITTVAGSGIFGYSGDGSAATSAELNAPTGLAVDSAGDLFIADSGNNVVRDVDLSTGVITTVAGNGTSGYSGDGCAATSAELNDPTGIACDTTGNLFIADSGNNVVRKVDLSIGAITTMAGNGTCGYSGNGGAATTAELNDPTGVAIDAAGDLFIADSGNDVIRQVDPTGVISTIAGSGAIGYTGDSSAAANVDFNAPSGIAASSTGNVFIADSGGDMVWKLAPPLYWDPGQTGTEHGGGSGTWTPDSGENYWYDPFVGSDVAWTDGSNAILSGSSGTVDMSSAVNPASITFDTSGYQVTNDAPSDSLNLPAGGTVNVAAAFASIASPIDDSGTLTIICSGTLVLDGNTLDGASPTSLIYVGTGSGVLVAAGANGYSGPTTIASGLFVVTGPQSLPCGTALTVMASGTIIFDSCQSAGSGQILEAPAPPKLTTVTSPGNPGGTPAPQADPAPAITAIQCAGPSLVDANSVTFDVAFSEPVAGVSADSFTVDGPGAVASISGSLSQYVVTVNVEPGASGTLGLEPATASTILDWNDTPLDTAAAIAVDQEFTISRDLYFDATAENAGGTPAPQEAWVGCNWHVGSPTGPLQGWVDGSNAFFSGPSATVTINQPVSPASITFLTDGWVLAGDPLTLAPLLSSTGEGKLVDVETGSAAIDCQFLADSFEKTGAGALVMAGGSGPVNSIVVMAGALDLGDTTLSANIVTLTGGSIVNGTLNVASTLDLYSGMVSANITGTAALDKLGPDTVLLLGDNRNSGGDNAQDGTLVAASAGSLAGPASGPGTVVVQPTLYWSGSGNWTTGTWQLADGTPTPWIDGSSVVIAAGSVLGINGTVNVSSITFQGNATISGGTLALPDAGTTIDVLSDTATVNSTLAGGGFTQGGPGTLVLDAATGLVPHATVDNGTLDLLSPTATPPAVVGGQAIGPGAVFSNGQSLDTTDPAMFSLVQSLFADQSINRTDMIQILDSAVANGSVSPSALAALEMLTNPQNEALLNVPNYVAVLAGDVVNGNPANSSYQGQPLGNLTDQTSGQAMATALTDLVGKWFYGTDLPAVPSYLSYNMVAGPLYGNNPNPALDVPSSADMEQGGVGDCYFISTLGSIADSSPMAIENMIIPNGVENGIASYTVRFYYQNAAGAFVADYVTVNALLPGYSFGSLAFARAGSDGSCWLPLVEKAYAEWNETGREGRDGQNAYLSLNDGFMQCVDAQVLGSSPAVSFPAASDLTAKQALINALQTSAAVTVGCGTASTQLQLVSGHAYDVAGYDANPSSPTFDTFQLQNPWGFYEPARLTWNQLCAYCGWLVVADAPQSVAAATSYVTTSSPAASVPGAEIRAAALLSVADRHVTPDAACLADFAGTGSSQGMDSSWDAHVRALDRVMAEAGW